MSVFYDRDEGWLFVGKVGRWTLGIRLPKVKLYRKRVHPSQAALVRDSVRTLARNGGPNRAK